MKTLPILRRLALAAPLAFLTVVADAAPAIQEWRTQSGVRVMFVEAPTIPMLDVELRFDAGARLDPAGQAGVARLAARLLDAGTDGLDEDAIAERFAMVGAQRSAWATDDSATVRLRSLTDPAMLEPALDLLVRMVSQPTYPEAVVARERQRSIQAVRDVATQPGAIASRRFAASIYPDHPYGRFPTEESLAAIEATDLQAFHRRHYTRSRMVVALIGAIDREQAERIAQRLVAQLPADGAPPLVPTVQGPTQGRELRIPHPSQQSHIRIGMPLIERGHPDQFALLIGNHVLGGGSFVSRLYTEVREKRGLAYSVYSSISPQTQPGPFTIGLQTQRERTAEALAVVRETLERWVREGPTDAEIAAAQSNLAGGFPMQVDSNREILGNIATIGFADLPLDYLDTWPERVRAVAPEEVRAAIRRHVDLDRLVTVVVGESD